MLQMRQSMPNDLPCLRKYEVHPVHLPEMWVDCYPSEDTNDSEGGEIMSKVQCYVNDDEIMCYWQHRFWQAYRMLTREQRDILADMPWKEEKE